MRMARGLFLQGAALAFGEDLGEEVVALVVDEDEGGEVFHFNLPDGFHAEFGVLEEFHFLDGVLGENGCGAADRAEVEAAVALAGVGDLLRAVALGNHNHGAAGCLELVNVGVHSTGCGGTERTGRHAVGSLGRTGVVDGVILEVLGHGLTLVEAFFNLPKVPDTHLVC